MLFITDSTSRLVAHTGGFLFRWQLAKTKLVKKNKVHARIPADRASRVLGKNLVTTRQAKGRTPTQAKQRKFPL